MIELPAKLPSKCQRKLSKGGCYMFLTSVFSFILYPVASPDEAKIMPAVKRKSFNITSTAMKGGFGPKEAIDQ